MKLFAIPLLPIAVVAFGLVSSQHAVAAADAKGTIEAFDASLLDVMKNADKLGYKGRYDKLAPVITQTYDLPLMARISVGPQWATLSADEQTKITDAFKALSIATFASRFDGFGGESFKITGEAPTTGGDDVVDTKLMRPDDEPVDLNYRLRKTGDDWKVIDVFLSGTISQLANYRSEFSTTLRTKGAEGLVQLINDKVTALAPKA